MGHKLQQIQQSIIFVLNFLRKHKFIRTKKQSTTENQPLINYFLEDNYSEYEDDYSEKSYIITEVV